MVALTTLDSCRDDLMENIERLRQRHQSSVGALVRQQIALARDMNAGAICLALTAVLEADDEAGRAAATAVGLLELSVETMGRLVDERTDLVSAHGFPLVLNSADAVFSLAQLAILELAERLGRLGPDAVRAFDEASMHMWEAGSDDYRRRLDTSNELGRLGGVLAGLCSGEEKTPGFGEMGSLIGGLVGGYANGNGPKIESVAQALGLSESQRARLRAFLRQDE
jgi:hypothetical protein